MLACALDKQSLKAMQEEGPQNMSCGVVVLLAVLHMYCELPITILFVFNWKILKKLCRPWPHKYMIDSLGLSKIMCELKTAQYSFLPNVKKDFCYVQFGNVCVVEEY